MKRRDFLGGLGALVGGVALEKAIPLGRVWSFPSQIHRFPILTDTEMLERYIKPAAEELARQYIRVLHQEMKFAAGFANQYHAEFVHANRAISYEA